MTFAGINYWAVILATVAAFLFGGLWYGMLGRQWMAAANLERADMNESRNGPSAVPFVVAFIAQLVMAAMLAGVIGHLGREHVTLRSGVVSGFFIWAGFILTAIVVNHAFQGAKRMLTVIDAGHWLGVMLIQGAIIGWMGVPHTA